MIWRDGRFLRLRILYAVAIYDLMSYAITYLGVGGLRSPWKPEATRSSSAKHDTRRNGVGSMLLRGPRENGAKSFHDVVAASASFGPLLSRAIFKLSMGRRALRFHHRAKPCTSSAI